MGEYDENVFGKEIVQRSLYLADLLPAVQATYRSEVLADLLAKEPTGTAFQDLTERQILCLESEARQEIVKKTADFLFDFGEGGRGCLIDVAQKRCLLSPKDLQKQLAQSKEEFGEEYVCPPDLIQDYVAMLACFPPAAEWLRKTGLSGDLSSVLTAGTGLLF